MVATDVVDLLFLAVVICDPGLIYVRGKMKPIAASAWDKKS